MRQRRAGKRSRVSRADALREIGTALASAARPDDALASALGIVRQELGTARAAVFHASEDGTLETVAAIGLAPETLPPRDLEGAPLEGSTLGAGDELHDRHGLALLVPIRFRHRTIGALALGPREDGYGADERRFLGEVARTLAATIEGGRLEVELRRTHGRLSAKVFELRNLFDLTRELAGSFSEDTVLQRAVTAVMGHFVVARCAAYVSRTDGLALAHGRGLGRETERGPIPPPVARAALEGLTAPRLVAELPPGPLRRRLEDARLALAVPMVAGERIEGVLGIGERASGQPFSGEDREVAFNLARQAMAALETVRLQRIREEKRRQDHELALAREIQQGLLPARPLELPGFETAGETRPCFEVGGDSYDWIPLGEERLALVVADVSGKGAPASLLMASTHAFVHALAGTAPPATLAARLNRFLFARTQASRFVTLFYAELDATRRRLAYVNAGHVPPYLVTAAGSLARLSSGGAALGLLPEEAYAPGEARLEAGDVLAMVTDGVTEALSPDERELGDDRVCETLRTLRGGDAPTILEGLIAAADAWAGGRASGDDLTALVLKAR
ncbi:MAG TPA: SpoIIE family protein phosphatase [Vicinamibacteria bacterium]|nr:SpoIIE family protein phosphatase [Vicinamibacteria bacterium]